MNKIAPFTRGNRDVVTRLNEIIAEVNKISRFTGDGLVSVNRTSAGYAINLNVDGLKRRLVYGNSGGGEFKRAFCVADAGEGNSIQCYLDEFETGEEVTVYCDICGGSSLSSAVPRLKEADAMCVAYLDGQWRCLTTFQASKDCVCVPEEAE